MKPKKTLKSVVSPSVYARLVKFGIKTFEDLKGIKPHLVMEVAALGPVKTQELYAAAGIKLDSEALKSSYNKLKERSRLAGVQMRQFGRNVYEGRYNPHILGLAASTPDLLRKLHNISRSFVLAGSSLPASDLRLEGGPEGKRLPEEGFEHMILSRVSEVLRGANIDNEVKMAKTLTGLIFIKPEGHNIHAQFTLEDEKSKTIVGPEKSILEARKDTEAFVQDKFKRYPDMALAIIYDDPKDQLNLMLGLGYTETVKDLAGEFEDKTAIFTKKEWDEGRNIERFRNNLQLAMMQKRFNKFRTFEKFIEYEEIRPGLRFEDFIKAYVDETIFNYETPGIIKSEIIPIQFGVLVPSMMKLDALQTYSRLPFKPTIDSFYPKDIQDFKFARSQSNINIGPKQVNRLAFLWAAYTLKDFEILFSNADNPIILRSVDIPEIGCLID